MKTKGMKLMLWDGEEIDGVKRIEFFEDYVTVILAEGLEREVAIEDIASAIGCCEEE